MLILRTCTVDMESYDGFTWPESGPVSCDDWKPTKKCGNGLHGLPWGEGDGGLLNWRSDAKWLVVEADDEQVICFNSKCKFPSGKVVFCGSRQEATQYIYTHGGAGKVIVGATITAGDRGAAIVGSHGTATVGSYGTATAGDCGTAIANHHGTATAGDDGTATVDWHGTATAGYHGTAAAGDRGTATAGCYGTATAGYRGTATAGRYGTATAGRYGTATAGFRGTATAGDDGTATAGSYGTVAAGYCGKATAGDHGTATAGSYGTVAAGKNGILQLAYYDGVRRRLATAYVGENGIKPNTKYKLNGNHEFVEVKQNNI